MLETVPDTWCSFTCLQKIPYFLLFSSFIWCICSMVPPTKVPPQLVLVERSLAKLDWVEPHTKRKRKCQMPNCFSNQFKLACAWKGIKYSAAFHWKVCRDLQGFWYHSSQENQVPTWKICIQCQLLLNSTFTEEFTWTGANSFYSISKAFCLSSI